MTSKVDNDYSERLPVCIGITNWEMKQRAAEAEQERKKNLAKLHDLLLRSGLRACSTHVALSHAQPQLQTPECIQNLNETWNTSIIPTLQASGWHCLSKSQWSVVTFTAQCLDNMPKPDDVEKSWVIALAKIRDSKTNVPMQNAITSFALADDNHKYAAACALMKSHGNMLLEHMPDVYTQCVHVILDAKPMSAADNHKYDAVCALMKSHGNMLLEHIPDVYIQCFHLILHAKPMSDEQMYQLQRGMQFLQRTQNPEIRSLGFACLDWDSLHALAAESKISKDVKQSHDGFKTQWKALVTLAISTWDVNDASSRDVVTSLMKHPVLCDSLVELKNSHVCRSILIAACAEKNIEIVHRLLPLCENILNKEPEILRSCFGFLVTHRPVSEKQVKSLQWCMAYIQNMDPPFSGLSPRMHMFEQTLFEGGFNDAQAWVVFCDKTGQNIQDLVFGNQDEAQAIRWWKAALFKPCLSYGASAQALEMLERCQGMHDALAASKSTFTLNLQKILTEEIQKQVKELNFTVNKKDQNRIDAMAAFCLVNGLLSEELMQHLFGVQLKNCIQRISLDTSNKDASPIQNLCGTYPLIEQDIKNGIIFDTLFAALGDNGNTIHNVSKEIVRNLPDDMKAWLRQNPDVLFRCKINAQFLYACMGNVCVEILESACGGNNKDAAVGYLVNLFPTIMKNSISLADASLRLVLKDQRFHVGLLSDNPAVMQQLAGRITNLYKDHVNEFMNECSVSNKFIAQIASTIKVGSVHLDFLKAAMPHLSWSPKDLDESVEIVLKLLEMMEETKKKGKGLLEQADSELIGTVCQELFNNISCIGDTKKYMLTMRDHENDGTILKIPQVLKYLTFLIRLVDQHNIEALKSLFAYCMTLPENWTKDAWLRVKLCSDMMDPGNAKYLSDFTAEARSQHARDVYALWDSCDHELNLNNYLRKVGPVSYVTLYMVTQQLAAQLSAGPCAKVMRTVRMLGQPPAQ